MDELNVACPVCKASKGFACKGGEHPERARLYEVSARLVIAMAAGK